MNPNPTTHTAEGLTPEQEQFLTYVATLTFLKTRLKDIDDTDYVHISQREIERRFFPWPEFSREKEIKKLIKHDHIIKKKLFNEKAGRNMDYYRGLRPCTPDPSLIEQTIPNLGETQKYMLDCLLNVDLEASNPSTPYFDFFLQHREAYPYLFFKFDDFSGRLHTPVTSLPASIREELLLYGQPVVSLDVAQMQPQILGKILKDYWKKNQFSQWMDTGADIYKLIAGACGLQTRAEGKKRFFQITFGRPSDELEAIFGYQEWITWINRYKRRRDTGNPRKRNLHANLAWKLQKTEVQIMKAVWIALRCADIPFLTVHDEIIVRRQDKTRAFDIFKNVLQDNFTHFELNVSH